MADEDCDWWDESGVFEEVVCPCCGSNTRCEHLVACVDTTCGEWSGGEATNYCDDWAHRVETKFLSMLQNGEEPPRNRFEIREAWDAVQKNDPEALKQGDIPLWTTNVIQLMFAALEASGGDEHPGTLVGPYTASGQSGFRLMHAKDPKAVCEMATFLLEKWLTNDTPATKERRQ